MIVRPNPNAPLATTSSRWSQPWSPSHPGDGFIIEGKVVKLRNHTISDSTSRYHRYVAVVLAVTRARRRKFDNGQEVDTEPYTDEKLVRKGYLNRYDHVKQEDPMSVSFSELQNAVGTSGSALPDGYFDTGRSDLHPQCPGIFEFWGDVNMKLSSEVAVEDTLKLKTKGSTIFIESFAKSSNLAGRYAGGDVKGTWDAKIMSVDKEEDTNLSTDQGGAGDGWGCDDDEWN